jgi:hypothetical protein
MPKLPFRPDADGFAFTNSFEFDAAERAVLASLAYPLVTAAVTMVSATFSPLLGAAVGLAVAEYVQLGPVPAY